MLKNCVFESSLPTLIRNREFEIIMTCISVPVRDGWQVWADLLPHILYELIDSCGLALFDACQSGRPSMIDRG